MRYVVIMAGGSGTRLWPLSRKGTPKQLLRLFDGKSLLRIAYERVQGIVPDECILICTGGAYSHIVHEEIPELPQANILGEPVGRDSLNAVAWPIAVIDSRDADAVVAFTSADALIEPKAAFAEALDEAYRVAEADDRALVTFGVVPTSPHTGFGYLHRGASLPGSETACEVLEFREKPDAETAKAYVDSGEYWWNSGMFVWQAKTLLRQLEILLPETHEKVLELAEHPERLEDVFPTLHKTSIDYGVMEPVSQGKGDAHVVGVALPIRWHDVGDYATLAEQLTHDADGNAREGIVTTLDARGNLIINRAGDDHVVAVAGCEGMAIVAMGDVTMVCPLSSSQAIKQLVALVGEQAGPQYQ